jgi:hypothetical protein
VAGLISYDKGEPAMDREQLRVDGFSPPLAIVLPGGNLASQWSAERREPVLGRAWSDDDRQMRQSSVESAYGAQWNA